MSDSKLSFQDFQKLELRVGAVTGCEPHPDADRLILLDVDLGPELGTRRLVAGIKAAYSADEIIGKQIIVCTNLEPATIRGVESQGMLLAATDGDTLAVLTPDRPVAPGSKVS